MSLHSGFVKNHSPLYRLCCSDKIITPQCENTYISVEIQSTCCFLKTNVKWGAAHSVRRRPLQVIRGHKALTMADSALMDHGAVVGHLDRLADAGLAPLHYTQFVVCVVYAQRCHLVTWEPLPARAKTEGPECWSHLTWTVLYVSRHQYRIKTEPALCTEFFRLTWKKVFGLIVVVTPTELRGWCTFKPY